jgi:hypothetical protein
MPAREPYKILDVAFHGGDTVSSAYRVAFLNILSAGLTSEPSGERSGGQEAKDQGLGDRDAMHFWVWCVYKRLTSSWRTRVQNAQRSE